jgi:hypothetical protein
MLESLLRIFKSQCVWVAYSSSSKDGDFIQRSNVKLPSDICVKLPGSHVLLRSGAQSPNGIRISLPARIIRAEH